MLDIFRRQRQTPVSVQFDESRDSGTAPIDQSDNYDDIAGRVGTVRQLEVHSALILGQTQAEIADRLGISQQAVSKALACLDRRVIAYRVGSDYDAGESIPAIARRYGLSVHDVGRLLETAITISSKPDPYEGRRSIFNDECSRKAMCINKGISVLRIVL